MRKLVFLLAAIVLLLAAPMACTTTIVPPGNPRDPVAVFVVPVSSTSSLLLPTRTGQLVRFVYGDWRYYALAENTVVNGLRALLWPTQGTLGRAALPGPPGPQRAEQGVDGDAVHEIRVERGAVNELVDELNSAYDAMRGTEVDNPPYGLRFVHHEPPYTYVRNSNHMVADWLRQLGCEVHGPAFGSRWRVEPRAPGRSRPSP